MTGEFKAAIDLTQFLRNERLHAEAEALKAEFTQRRDFLGVERLRTRLDATVRLARFDAERVTEHAHQAPQFADVQERRRAAAEVEPGKPRRWQHLRIRF